MLQDWKQTLGSLRSNNIITKSKMGSKEDTGPSNSWFFKEGDVPWILKKDDISLAKEFIMGVRVPPSYESSVLRVKPGGNSSNQNMLLNEE